MFSVHKSKPKGETIEFKIEGMHCTSCAMNIDGELEDVSGVLKAQTSYAKSLTTVTYDSEKVSLQKLIKVINNVGYKVKE